MTVEEELESSITFLAETTFRSRDEIRQVLKDNDCNVQRTLDMLLNLNYLETPPVSAPASPKIPQAALPHKKKEKHTFSLTSNKFQNSRPSSPRITNASLPLRNGSSVDESNDWIKLDSLAVRIGGLMAIPANDFSSMFHKRNLSFILALETYLLAFEQTRPFDLLLFQPPLDTSIPFKQAKEDLLQNLAAVVPDPPFSSPAAWKRFLSASNGDIENAIELSQLFLDFKSKEGMPDLVDLTRNLPDVAVAPQDVKETKEWTTVKRMEVIARPATASALQCRRVANEYKAQSMDAKMEAKRHAQLGRGGALNSQGERASAMHWSEKSLYYAKKAREWEEIAAAHLISERQRESGKNVVDLHNLNATEALKIVSENLNVWYSSKETAPLILITGRGTHSVNSKPVLLPAVERYLQKEGWRYKLDRDGGQLFVTGLMK